MPVQSRSTQKSVTTQSFASNCLGPLRRPKIRSADHEPSLLILVVDDEPDIELLFRQQFRRDLRSARFVMEFAQSALAALERIADAADVTLVLVLSDVNMPGMSGLELLPRARSIRPDVPVIMITAYGDPDTTQRAMESGAEALLTKPIDFTALREEIDTCIRRLA
ncbi:response regulator [Sinorhizobium medicae]|nr:response regulator [Sinorhizobium medicae]